LNDVHLNDVHLNDPPHWAMVRRALRHGRIARALAI
jgi:hypothetical protein